MCVVKNRNRASKTPHTNPYAGRGLDKFALVSAELEAKRERLVAQLGSPLSLVRFAIGPDQNKWIPIIICPTLSKAEIHTLRRAGTLLITEDKPAMSVEKGHQVRTSEVLLRETNTHSSSLTDNDHNVLSTRKHPSHDVTVAHVGDAKVYQTGILAGLIAALDRFLWMATFSLSILADRISNAILSKWHAEVVPRRNLPSTRRPKEEKGTAANPSSGMTSSTDIFPLPPPHAPSSIPTRDIKVITLPHPLHVKAHKTHNWWNTGWVSTAPSTPRDSRRASKPFLGSVSLPNTRHLQDQTPHKGTMKDTRLLTSVSLLKTPHLQEPNAHKVLRSSTSTGRGAVSKKERKERSEKLGQAMTGAWLALGLGGLVMGFIPAIVGVICWWYALPGMRKAVGDTPFVKSHHHEKISKEDNNSPPLNTITVTSSKWQG